MKHRVGWTLGGIAGAVILGLVGFFYVTVVRPAASVMVDLDKLAELRSMNAGLRNTASFSPPPDGNLTEEQVARFSRVQAAMRVGLGTDYPLLDERALRLKGLAGGESGAPAPHHLGIREAILAFKGLGPVLLRAKEIQINALNTEEFSLAEYRWVREHVYRALGFSRTSVYIEDLAAELKKSKRWESGEAEVAPDPSEVDRERVSGLSDSGGEMLPFLVFGL